MKYLVHTLLHCLSSKSTSWDQFGTNIASALVGLATNQKFNFSKLIFDGMLRNLKDSKPFLMYPSDDSSAGKKAESPSPVASKRPASPNDYTPTDEVQTSGGDIGNLDLHGLTREVLSLKKQNAKQAAQILRLKTKIKILVKKVKPVIAEYSSFVKLKATLSKKKKLKKAHKKKSSSFKQGRKKVSDGSTGLNEDDVNSGDSQMMDVDDTISAEVHEGTAQVNEGTAKVHEGITEVNEGTAEVNKGIAELPHRKLVGAEQQAALRRSKPPTISQLRNQMMKYIRNVGGKAYRNLKNKSYEEIKDIYEKVVDFEGDSAQDVEVMEQRSSISRFLIVQSPEGEYIAVQRANGHIELVIEYYEHIPPTGLGLILHGDLTTMMETTEESDDELWRNQTEWEIIIWRLYESTSAIYCEREWDYDTYFGRNKGIHIQRAYAKKVRA
ncbi:hypothetical protein Tco_1155634 [Tanacetum coccineum]